MRLLNDIIGKEIINQNAKIIGKVKDIEVDTATNKIESIILTEGGFNKRFGKSNDETIIPYEAVSTVGDKIIIKNEFY